MGDQLVRRGPFQITDSATSTFTEARIATGPCEDVNREFVEMLRDVALMLYGYVAASRTLPTRNSKQLHAVEQIQFASAGLAAAEAETIVTLVSLGLCGPARIHVRTLGEVARRCALVAIDPSLGEQFYDSLEASRRQLADKVPENHLARPLVDQIFEPTDAPTMENLERAAGSKFAALNEYGYIISGYERRDYSKWAHGDVVALADVADRVRDAGDTTKINTAINVDRFPEMMLHRSAQFGILILSVLNDRHVGAASDVDALNRRCELLTPTIREYMEALKISVEKALMSQNNSETRTTQGPETA